MISQEETNILIDKYIYNLADSNTIGEAMDGLQHLVKNGLDKQVHERIECLMKVYPDSFILCNINAWLYRQIGNKQRALIFYQKCYDIMPNKDSLEEIFNCYFWQGLYKEALPIAQRIVKDYGSSHKILVVKTLIRMSSPEEAIRIIEESLQDISTFENKFAEEALAFAGAQRCFDMGNYDKALSFANRAMDSLQIGNGKHIKELIVKIKTKKGSKEVEDI